MSAHFFPFYRASFYPARPDLPPGITSVAGSGERSSFPPPRFLFPISYRNPVRDSLRLVPIPRKYIIFLLEILPSWAEFVEVGRIVAESSAKFSHLRLIFFRWISRRNCHFRRIIRLHASRAKWKVLNVFRLLKIVSPKLNRSCTKDLFFLKISVWKLFAQN